MGQIVTWLGCLILALVVGLELGAQWVVQILPRAGDNPPGLAILTLALLDVLLLYSWTTIKLGGLVRESILTPTLKITNFVIFLVLLIVAILAIIAAFTLLLLMVSLLMAIPFGPPIYLAGFGTFPVGTAQVLLSAIAVLKLAFAAVLIIAQPRLLADYRKFVFLLALSIGCTYLISFLHVLAPRPLAALTDAVGAIVVGVIGAALGLYYLVGALWAVIMLLVDLWRGARKPIARS